MAGAPERRGGGGESAAARGEGLPRRHRCRAARGRGQQGAGERALVRCGVWPRRSHSSALLRQIATALADVAAAEASLAEAEGALSAARSAEATATRAARSYEEQLRDLRGALSSAVASAGAREDELRAELEDAQGRLLRAQAAAEEQGVLALAQAYGLVLTGAPGLQQQQQQQHSLTSPAGGHARGGGGGGSDALATPSREPGGMSSGSGSSSGGVAEALVAQLAHMQADAQVRGSPEVLGGPLGSPEHAHVQTRHFPPAPLLCRLGGMHGQRSARRCRRARPPQSRRWRQRMPTRGVPRQLLQTPPPPPLPCAQSLWHCGAPRPASKPSAPSSRAARATPSRASCRFRRPMTQRSGSWQRPAPPLLTYVAESRSCRAVARRRCVPAPVLACRHLLVRCPLGSPCAIPPPGPHCRHPS